MGTVGVHMICMLSECGPSNHCLIPPIRSSKQKTCEGLLTAKLYLAAFAAPVTQLVVSACGNPALTSTLALLKLIAIVSSCFMLHPGRIKLPAMVLHSTSCNHT